MGSWIQPCLKAVYPRAVHSHQPTHAFVASLELAAVSNPEEPLGPVWALPRPSIRDLVPLPLLCLALCWLLRSPQRWVRPGLGPHEVTGLQPRAHSSLGAHLDHLEHFDGRVLEAVFPQEGADGVNGLVHLIQELAVGLEKLTDELVEVPGWGLVKERGLQREHREDHVEKGCL